MDPGRILPSETQMGFVPLGTHMGLSHLAYPTLGPTWVYPAQNSDGLILMINILTKYNKVNSVADLIDSVPRTTNVSSIIILFEGVQ